MPFPLNPTINDTHTENGIEYECWAIDAGGTGNWRQTPTPADTYTGIHTVGKWTGDQVLVNGADFDIGFDWTAAEKLLLTFEIQTDDHWEWDACVDVASLLQADAINGALALYYSTSFYNVRAGTNPTELKFNASGIATAHKLTKVWAVGEITTANPATVTTVSRFGDSNPGNGNRFAHSTEVSNIGDIAYDGAGTYTIGTSGVYSIDYSLLTVQGANTGNVTASLFAKGAPVGPAVGASNDGSNWPFNGSAAITLSLTAADTVELRQISTPGFGGTNKTTSLTITRIGSV